MSLSYNNLWGSRSLIAHWLKHITENQQMRVWFLPDFCNLMSKEFVFWGLCPAFDSINKSIISWFELPPYHSMETIQLHGHKSALNCINVAYCCLQLIWTQFQVIRLHPNISIGKITRKESPSNILSSTSDNIYHPQFNIQ